MAGINMFPIFSGTSGPSIDTESKPEVVLKNVALAVGGTIALQGLGKIVGKVSGKIVNGTHSAVEDYTGQIRAEVKPVQVNKAGNWLFSFILLVPGAARALQTMAGVYDGVRGALDLAVLEIGVSDPSRPADEKVRSAKAELLGPMGEKALADLKVRCLDPEYREIVEPFVRAAIEVVSNGEAAGAAFQGLRFFVVDYFDYVPAQVENYPGAAKIIADYREEAERLDPLGEAPTQEIDVSAERAREALQSTTNLKHRTVNVWDTWLDLSGLGVDYFSARDPIRPEDRMEADRVAERERAEFREREKLERR